MAEFGGGISLSQARDPSHNSDDEDEDQSPHSVARLCGDTASGGSSRAKSLAIVATPNNKKSGAGGEMGSTGQTVRKPRGRPPGSKNKPKPPIVITRDSESSMKPAVLEISAGADIVQQVVEFARRQHVGLTVMSGSGTISNVTLRHPMTQAPTISLHGPLHIVCLSGTYLGASGAPSSCSSFSISLAGSQGQVFGGIVAGKVIAQSPVVVVAATFVNPPFYRLPSSEASDKAEEGTNGGGGGISFVGGNEVACTGNSLCKTAYSPGATATSMNCQISPDVLHWSSTSRSPPY